MPAPTAAFTYTPESGSASLSVAFTDTSTGSPTSWIWNFGDGTALSSDPRPSAYVFYEMDENGSATSAVDATGNGHTGVYTGITHPTPGVTGRFNNGYAFSNGYILGPTIPPTSASWTAACWVNTTATTLQVAMCRWNGTFPGTNFPWAAGLNTDGTPFFTLYTNVGGTAATLAHISAAINDGSWHHMCVMKNSTTVSLWIDGVEVGSTSVASDPFGAGIPFTVGSVQAAMDQFNGSMDDAGFWNNILTAEQIYTLAHFPPSTAAQNPTHIYANAGSYTATLTAVNGSGASAPVTAPVTVYGHIFQGFDTNWANEINTDGSGKATTVLSNQNRTISLNMVTSIASCAVFGGVAVGKRYAEFTIGAVGASGKTGVGVRNTVGWDPTDYGVPLYDLTGSGVWIYRSDGKLYSNSASAAYGATYGPGDVIGIAIACSGGNVTTLTFYKNGVSQGAVTLTFASVVPAQVPIVAQTETFAAETITVTFNGGDDVSKPFSVSPPATYPAWGTICGIDYASTSSASYLAVSDLVTVGLGTNVALSGLWGRLSGKYYYEIRLVNSGSPPSYVGGVGINDATKNARGPFSYPYNTFANSVLLQACDGGVPGGIPSSTIYAFLELGSNGNNLQFSTDTSTPPQQSGSDIGVAVDMDNGLIYFFVDGVIVKDNGGVNARSLSIFTGPGTPVYPFFQVQGTGVVTATANFAGPFHGGGFGPTILGHTFSPWGSLDSAPVAAFTTSRTEIIQGASVTFTDTSTGTPTTWAWDFGDGGTSTAQNPTHTFAVGGIYTVTLTATNGIGSSAPATQVVQVAVWAHDLVPLSFSMDYVNYINTEGVNSASLSDDWLTLSLTIPASAAHGARVYTNEGRRNGKWYTEFTINSLTGVIAVGIGSMIAYNAPISFETPPGAVTEPCFSLADGDAGSYPDICYRSDGHAGTASGGDAGRFAAYGASYGAGDVIGLAVDFDALTARFYKNGISQGLVSLVGFTAWTIARSGWVPMVGSSIAHSNTGSAVSVTINGGDSLFTETLPVGFTPWRDLCEFDTAWSQIGISSATYDPSTHTQIGGGPGGVATFGRWAGQYYFEMVASSTVVGSPNGNYIGITDQHRYFQVFSFPAIVLFAAQYGVQFGGGHGAFLNGDFNTLLDMGPSSAPALGDTVGVGVDLDNGRIYIFLNGVQIYTHTFDPKASIGWYPFTSNGNTNFTTVLNFTPGSIPTALDATTFKAWGAFGVPPTADFTWTPNTGFAPLAVAFTDTSTGSPTSWLWDFGDSTTSTAQNPTHTFVSGGTYTVTLTASNANGPSTPDPQSIIIETLLPPVVPTQSTAGAIGTPFEYQIQATNSPTGYGAPGLPAGLSVNATTGLITGTPTGPAETTVLTASATNGSGTGHGQLTILILAGLPAVRSDALTINQGTPFVYDIVATLDPIAYDATGLPAGLVVDHTTGVISGTPTGVSNGIVTLSASNLAGTGFGRLTLQVLPSPTPGLTTQLSPGVYPEAPEFFTEPP